MIRALVLPFALALAACSMSTPYRASVDQGQPGAAKGYRTAELAPGRYQVTFAGNWLTPRETVESFMLYRAAEVAVADGYDYFVVRDRLTDTRRIKGGVAPTYAGGVYSDIECYYQGAVYTASATIEAGRGAAPADQPEAYDARAVLKRIGPRVEADGPRTL